MIADNIKLVKNDIDIHCSKSGRSSQDVTLIAVSKTKPMMMILEAYEGGQRHFGENKVQEIKDKQPLMPDAKWHMIGHLQTNKIKYIIDKVVLIHSVDSYKLAEAIHNEAKKRGLVMDILIQINVAEETSKFGISVPDVESFIREVARLENLKIKGLMTIAPYVVDAEENRPIFRKMKDIFIDIQNKNIDNVDMGILSMGMTNDYGVAIEEGSTMIRVGTGIFGIRN